MVSPHGSLDLIRVEELDYSPQALSPIELTVKLCYQEGPI